MRSKSNILKPVIPSVPPGRRIQISGFREKNEVSIWNIYRAHGGKEMWRKIVQSAAFSHRGSWRNVADQMRINEKSTTAQNAEGIIWRHRVCVSVHVYLHATKYLWSTSIWEPDPQWPFGHFWWCENIKTTQPIVGMLQDPFYCCTSHIELPLCPSKKNTKIK